MKFLGFVCASDKVTRDIAASELFVSCLLRVQIEVCIVLFIFERIINRFRDDFK